MKEKGWIALFGGSLILILAMIVGVFGVILYHGLPNFWPKDLYLITLKSGQTYLGEIHGKEKIPETHEIRLRLRTGNRDWTGEEFVWIEEKKIQKESKPGEVVSIERTEWGKAFGFLDDLPIEEAKKKVKKAHLLRKTLSKKLKKEILPLQRKIEKAKQQGKLPRAWERLYEEKLQEWDALKREGETLFFPLRDAEGTLHQIPLLHVLSVDQPNRLSVVEKTFYFLRNFFAFLFTYPRESNTEGGIFPALYGTILLVLLMSLFVFPLGVMTAIYLNEYAKQGFWVSLIRITIFNLAGVPSIVYGLFGLGFFVYTVGGGLDKLFFADKLPNPTLGTGGLLWASLTLALLTLPVVIVSSMEGLQAIPREFREGAYALGATKWEVIKDIVIPSALPGMLTGLILAISRAAGEVAPLMLTGVVKLAPAPLVDTHFPFLHFERKFMHLGFHIYDVGFQSPNVEAVRPMVFNTTLVLLLLVFLLNLVAIVLRNRIRKKFHISGV